MSEIQRLEDLKQLEAMKPEVAEEIDTYRLSFQLRGGKDLGFDEITIYDCNDYGCYASSLIRFDNKKYIYGSDNFSRREEARCIKSITFALNSIQLHGAFDNEHVRWLIEKGEKYK